MKKFYLILLSLAIHGMINGQCMYDELLPVQCSPISGGMETMTFPNTPPPIGDGTLIIDYTGDIDLISETIDFIGEGGVSMGLSVSTPQCTGVGTFTYTVPQDSILAWASSGSIEILADAAPAVGNFCACPGGGGGTSFSVVGHLTYPIALNPNDAGISEIYSPQGPSCGGDSIIEFRISNFGSTVINNVNINYSFNGVIQTPVSLTGLNIDTCEVLDTSIVVGPISLPSAIAVWTSMPNGVVDTIMDNDSAYANTHTGMSGVYTVGPSGLADFITIQDAIDSLDDVGVCAACVFDIESGTYNEQLVFPEIVGASAINTMTFQAASLNNADVTVTHNNNNFSSNYTVQMDGADHVIWNEMTFENASTTFARVFDYSNGANWNTTQNCVITNNLTTTTSFNAILVFSTSSQDNNNHFVDNDLFNGSWGFFWQGVNAGSLEEGTVIRGNTFRGQFETFIEANFQDGVSIVGNDMESTSTNTGGSFGIDMSFCDNGFTVMSNSIRSINRMPTIGVRILSCDNNSINRGLAANNCVRIGQAGNTFTFFQGIDVSNSGFLDVLNNTITIEGGSNFLRALDFNGGGVNTVINNSISLTNTNGVAINFNDPYTVTTSENNNIYSTGSGFGFFAGQNYADLASWQAGTNFDLAGVSVDPNFAGIDCEPCNDSLQAADPGALQQSGVTNDLEGTPRSLTQPDIGAVEFVSVGNFSLGDSLITACGSSQVLELGGNAQSVLWSTGEITNSITVTTSGAYSVTAVTACGSAVDTVVVDIVGDPQLNPHDHMCADENKDLDVGITGANYTWSTGEFSQIITVDNPGTYIVTVTKADCELIDTTVVTQSEAVELPSNDKICDGQSLTIDATIQDGVIYSWTPSAGTPSVTINTTDIYSVTVTDSWGCVSSDSLDLVVVTEPEADFLANFHNLAVEFTNLTPNTGGTETYLWDFGHPLPNNTSTLRDPVHIYPWSNPPQVVIATLTVTNECGTSTISKEISISTGVSDLNNELGVLIYPNPNNGMFTVEIDNAKDDVTIEVLDVSGRFVFTENFVGNGVLKENIDLSNVNQGFYFVKLISNNKIAVTGLVIK